VLQRIVDWCYKLSLVDRAKMEEAMRKMTEELNKKMREAIKRSK